MAEGYVATKGNVEIFLKELKQILSTPKAQLNIIQSYDNKIVLCMSFHYAEYKINKFPYK